MIKKIRQRFESVRCNKRHTFDDFDPIIQQCLREYSHLFPKRKINKDGSKVVYHPNVEELSPISLEKEHGSREFIPYRYARFAIQGIDDLISYVETHPDAERGRTEESADLGSDESNAQRDVRGPNAGDQNPV